MGHAVFEQVLQPALVVIGGDFKDFAGLDTDGPGGHRVNVPQLADAAAHHTVHPDQPADGHDTLVRGTAGLLEPLLAQDVVHHFPFHNLVITLFHQFDPQPVGENTGPGGGDPLARNSTTAMLDWARTDCKNTNGPINVKTPMLFFNFFSL